MSDHSECNKIESKQDKSDAKQASNLEQMTLHSSLDVIFGDYILFLILYLYRPYTIKGKKNQQLFENLNTSNNLQNYYRWDMT